MTDVTADKALVCCSFDNAEVYAGGKAEEVMGQAIKVSLPLCSNADSLTVIVDVHVSTLLPFAPVDSCS